MPSSHRIPAGAVVATLALALPLAACGGGGSGEQIGTQGSAITPIPGCDYSFARPTPASLVSMGYAFVARYLSGEPTGGKDITAAEATSIKAAGMDIVLVWETTGDDALNGYNAGVSDAQAAASEATSVGAPATRPIYFALDFDEASSQSAAVDEYFKGVASVIGVARTGAYGGYYAINQLFDAGLITFGWQTYAWSGGTWDSRAQLRQTENGLDNDEIDADSGMVADFGQWGPGAPSGTAEYGATFVGQSFPLATTALKMTGGQTIASYVELKNSGTKAWDSNTRLATTQPRNRVSVFADSSWLATDRPAAVVGTVAPGGTYKFAFNLHAPDTAGTYLEYFGVVEDGVVWFSDSGQGGPADNDLEVQIIVTAAKDAGGSATSDADAPSDGATPESDASVEGDASIEGDASLERDAGEEIDARAPVTKPPVGTTHAHGDGSADSTPESGGGCSVAHGDQRPLGPLAPLALIGLALASRRRRAARITPRR